MKNRFNNNDLIMLALKKYDISKIDPPLNDYEKAVYYDTIEKIKKGYMPMAENDWDADDDSLDIY